MPADNTRVSELIFPRQPGLSIKAAVTSRVSDHPLPLLSDVPTETN